MKTFINIYQLPERLNEPTATSRDRYCPAPPFANMRLQSARAVESAKSNFAR
jgi:hypothetical protein